VQDTRFLEPGKRHKNEYSLNGDGGRNSGYEICKKALAAWRRLEGLTYPRLISREVPQQCQPLGYTSRIWNLGIQEKVV
jgi:hypothetical protein